MEAPKIINPWADIVKKRQAAYFESLNLVTTAALERGTTPAEIVGVLHGFMTLCASSLVDIKGGK